MDEDQPGRVDRFPPNARTARRAGVGAVLLSVALCVAGCFVGFSTLQLLGSVGVVGLAAVGSAITVRDTGRNWIELGERETTLSIDGLVSVVSNDDVVRVWWTRCNAPGADKQCTGLELWVGERRHRRRLELYLTGGQRRRAFRRASETFTAASWTYDSGAGVLVPDAEWGPGEPVPDLRVRARWRARRNDPLARDPLAHRHRGHRTRGRRGSGTGGRRSTREAR